MLMHTKLQRSYTALLAHSEGLETREESGDLEEIRQALAEIETKASEGKKIGEKVDAVDKLVTKLDKRLDDLEMKLARPNANNPFAGLSKDREKADGFKSLSTFFQSGEGLERRAVTSTGTGTSGGFALPEVIDALIMDQIRNISPIRQIAQVVQTTSSDYKKLVGTGGVGTAWNAETTDRSAETASPTMAEVAPTHGELWAKPEISQWALDDLVGNPEAWLQQNISDEFAKAEGAAFVSGDGVNKPTGFLAGPTPLATGDSVRAFGTLQYLPSGAAGAFVAATASVSPADCLINMIYALKSGYRANAAWVMNSQTAGTVRKFKDLEGRFLWSDPLMMGQPALLLGYPVMIAEDMPDIGANSLSIAFGDFGRGYIIADRVGMRAIRDEVTKPGFVKYLVGKRLAGKLLDTNAIKVLRMSVT